MRSRPLAPASTAVAGFRAGATASNAERGSRPQIPSGHQRRGHEAHREQQHVGHTGPASAQAHGERPLARRPIGGDVSEVVDHEQRRGQQADRDRRGNGEPADMLDHHEGGAGGGYDAEEDEHEQLTEPHISVRFRTTGVEPGRGDGAAPDGDQPPTRRGRQHQPRGGGDTKGRERRPFDRLWGHQPRGHQPRGADATGVGAPNPVGVVVGVVRADLQCQADHQRQRSPPWRDGAVCADRARCADEDGNDRSGQGARSGTEHPGVVHGRQR